MNFSVGTLGYRTRPPYADTPEARGSSRKPTEAKNSPTPLESEYFQEFQRWDFGLPYPTPYMGKPEARGSSRKLKMA